MNELDDFLSVQDIKDAKETIESVAHKTPLDPSNTLAAETGANEARLKLENLQRTGSFKFRGAYNTVSRLVKSTEINAVISESSGNHAQGMALAGKQLGMDVTIVMALANLSMSKIAATRGYGADVKFHGATYIESMNYAKELAEGENQTFVHPFTESEVIAGQGTIGLEILDDFPEVDTILVPVGGGGLISGVSTAVKAHDSDIRVIGVQSEGASYAKKTLNRGEIHEIDSIDTIAEGIATTRLEEETFQIMNKRVDSVVEVNEKAISTAITILAERGNIIAEGAGAVTTAALIDGVVDVEGENVVAIVSGGNIELTKLAGVIKQGLADLNRYVTMRLSLKNWSDSMKTVFETVEDGNAEIHEISTESPTPDSHPNRKLVSITVEGSSREHLNQVSEALDTKELISVIESVGFDREI